MDLTKFNIDVENEAEESRDFSPLPDGQYPAIVTVSEIKDTKAGNGQFLALTFEVIDGDHKGRKVWANLNIQNPSAACEKIGRAQLASLCKAVGVMNPQDSQELHDIPLVIRIGKDKGDPNRNDVKGYSQIGDAYEPPVEEKKAAPAKPAAPAAKKKPWQK